MRKKKMITVEFDDGVQYLPSSVKIKCNITGTEKGFYTPYLIELIKRKYENNYKHFIDSYTSKGMRKTLNEESTEPDLSLYRNALQLEYAYWRQQPKTTKVKRKIGVIKERFTSRFPGIDINEHYIQ